jgi:hypothetical protein
MSNNANIRKSCEGTAIGARLVDAGSLGEMLAMTRHQIGRLRRMGKIPSVKFGYRTHRYDIEEVLATLGGAK